MRVLWLTRTYPYPPIYGGDIAYSRGVVESLGQAAEVTALAATNGDLAPGRHAGPAGVTWELVEASRRPAPLSLVTGMPNIMWRHATPAYHRRLAALLAQPWDGVVVDHLGAAHVLPQVRRWRAAHPRGRVLYLSHEHEQSAREEKYANYEGGALRRAVMRLDGAKIGAWEDRLCAGVDIISAINPGEIALFRADFPDKRYIATTPGYDGPRLADRVIDAATPRRVALLGGRGPIHKRLILRRWLEVSAERFAAAGVELDVIGNMEADLAASLAARHPKVRFSGYVEDLAAHLATCRLGVVPDFIGRGVKVRLLSYIFTRTPMAGIDSAIDGLPIAAPACFREAPTLEALADLCVSLVDDIPALNSLQQAAWDACEHGFDWPDRGRDIAQAIAAGQASATAASTASP